MALAMIDTDYYAIVTSSALIMLSILCITHTRTHARTHTHMHTHIYTHTSIHTLQRHALLVMGWHKEKKENDRSQQCECATLTIQIRSIKSKEGDMPAQDVNSYMYTNTHYSKCTPM